MKKKIQETPVEVDAASEPFDDKGKYLVNRETDTYIINLKSRSKPLIVRGAKHRAIIKAFSGKTDAPQSVEEVALRFKIPVAYVEEYKRIFSMSRDSLPLSDEEIEDKSVDELADQVIEEKRFAILQEIEKEEWKEIQKDATKWRKFENYQFDPFALVLEGWTPPKLAPLTKAPVRKDVSDKVLVTALSDLHFGSAANSLYMYNRPDWTTKDTVAAVANYASTIKEAVDNRKYKFKKLIVMALGDLIHSLNGKTARGTELKYDCIREEQFDYALTSLSSFIGYMADIVPCVEVHSVYGNHNYEAEMGLFRALEGYFKKDERVTFKHYASRPAAFREGETLFVLDHGADSVERAYVPTGSDSKLQLHVQSILLSTPLDLFVGAKSRIFCMGDKHHWENIEYNDFEFVMFGTIVGADEHAATNNLKNRARQSALVIGDNGLEEVLHYYPI